jgi:hypothetical protein
LQALKRAGRVGSVGITGLPLPVFRRVLDAAPPGLVDVVRTRATLTTCAHSQQPAVMLMGAAQMPTQVLSYGHLTLYDTSLQTWLPYFRARPMKPGTLHFPR